jgi:Fe-S cluster assembly protein SufB
MIGLDEVIVKDGVDQETVDAVREVGGAYKYGWETEIEMEYAPKGLNEDIVRLISEKNEEPRWMTDWRLAAFERWLKLLSPNGPWSTILRSTFKTSITMPDQNL